MAIDWGGRVEELIALLAGGASTADLARHFGTSECSVRNAMKRRKLRVNADAARERRIKALRERNEDPEFRARRTAMVKLSNADPVLNAKRRRGVVRSWQKPERRAVQVEAARAHWAKPGAIEARVDAWHRNRDARSAAKAAARAEAERRAKLSPFERLLEDVKAGKRQVVERPVLRPREHDFTLGGVSGALL